MKFLMFINAFIMVVLNTNLFRVITTTYEEKKIYGLIFNGIITPSINVSVRVSI